MVPPVRVHCFTSSIIFPWNQATQLQFYLLQCPHKSFSLLSHTTSNIHSCCPSKGFSPPRPSSSSLYLSPPSFRGHWPGAEGEGPLKALMEYRRVMNRVTLIKKKWRKRSDWWEVMRSHFASTVLHLLRRLSAQMIPKLIFFMERVFSILWIKISVGASCHLSEASVTLLLGELRFAICFVKCFCLF